MLVRLFFHLGIVKELTIWLAMGEPLGMEAERTFSSYIACRMLTCAIQHRRWTKNNNAMGQCCSTNSKSAYFGAPHFLT